MIEMEYSRRADERYLRYEEHFSNSLKIISRWLTQLSSLVDKPTELISSCVEIETELAEAEGYLEALRVEVKT
jgi:hypothetical protein